MESKGDNTTLEKRKLINILTSIFTLKVKIIRYLGGNNNLIYNSIYAG